MTCGVGCPFMEGVELLKSSGPDEETQRHCGAFPLLRLCLWIASPPERKGRDYSRSPYRHANASKETLSARPNLGMLQRRFGSAEISRFVGGQRLKTQVFCVSVSALYSSDFDGSNVRQKGGRNKGKAAPFAMSC